MQYSEKVMDHFMNPRNVGIIEKCDSNAYGKDVANYISMRKMNKFMNRRYFFWNN